MLAEVGEHVLGLSGGSAHSDWDAGDSASADVGDVLLDHVAVDERLLVVEDFFVVEDPLGDAAVWVDVEEVLPFVARACLHHLGDKWAYVFDGVHRLLVTEWITPLAIVPSRIVGELRISSKLAELAPGLVVADAHAEGDTIGGLVEPSHG